MPRKFILYSCLYIASFVCMGGYAYAVRGVNAIFTYIGIAVCLFFFFCIVSQECFSKKSFLFFTYFGLFSIIDNSLSLIIDWLLPQLSAPARYYLTNVLRTGALLLILVLYKKYAASVVRSIADIGKRRWWKLVLIALMFYLLQAVLTILKALSVMPELSMFLIFAVASFFMCAVYGVVFSNISYMKKDAEAALVRQNAEYLSAQISTLQNAEKMHQRFRHDMRHHLKIIAEYAKADDVSSILAYVREYSIEISETAVKQYSINSMINMILSVYAGKVEESGIKFSVRCSVPEKMTVRDIDLIALFGNLLENALHGCQKAKKENSYIEIYIPNDVLDNVKVETVSGAITVDDCAGVITLSTTSGGINIFDSNIAGNVNTVSGTIGLYPSDMLGNLNVNSHSGKISAILPTSISYNIKAETATGKIKGSYFDTQSGNEKEFSGIVGENPKCTITLKTFSANIEMN